MRIKTFCAALLLGIGWGARAQQMPVLMNVGGQEVSCAEFEYAYRAAQEAGGDVSPEQFLDAFADRKLKVAAAKAAGLDTLQVFRNRCEAYRRRLVRSYLTDEATVEELARRAYEEDRATRDSVRVLVRQVFKALPQHISARDLQAQTERMDSIYNLLKADSTGRAFDACVERFSDEKEAFWVEKLQMPEDFEKTAFALSVGEVSSPFFTPMGIHIVKVVDRRELPPAAAAGEALCHYRSLRRIVDAGVAVKVEQLKQVYGYRPDSEGMKELMASGQTARTLFVLNDTPYTGKEFALFAASYPAAVGRQLEAFVRKSVLRYADSRLDEEHPELRYRLQAYRDRELERMIFHREVREKVLAADEAALQGYFLEHRSDYRWDEPRYKGIVLHGVTKRAVKRARKFLKSLPEEERGEAVRLMFQAPADTVVCAEQGIFAKGDNAYVDEQIFKQPKAVPQESYPFTVLLGKKVKGPEGYREVQDRLLPDYQRHLEQCWTDCLRASFKVEINQEVLKTVNNH